MWRNVLITVRVMFCLSCFCMFGKMYHMYLTTERWDPVCPNSHHLARWHRTELLLLGENHTIYGVGGYIQNLGGIRITLDGNRTEIGIPLSPNVRRKWIVPDFAARDPHALADGWVIITKNDLLFRKIFVWFDPGTISLSQNYTKFKKSCFSRLFWLFGHSQRN